MKKIRILALLLAVLMIPFSLLVACKKDSEKEDECANGHDWNKKEEIVEKRTCTTSGIRKRTCKICKLEEEYEWKPDGHTIEKAEWIYDEDATCTVDGHESRMCALCTYSQTRVKTGSALGHNFVTYVLGDDKYSETAVCDRCSDVTDTRLVGINLDFEGERNTLSYGSFTVYTAEGITDYYKTEGENETFNTYLQLDRTSDITIGDNGYSAIFAPGYSRLMATKYVVEFDIKINKENTGDLILLSGNKTYSSVDFLTYDADTKTIGITYGPIYTLQDTDYDRWLSIAVVLNDVERNYEFYIDRKLVIAGVEYQADNYYAGIDLESFKIGMTHEVGVASTLALDNIDVYIGVSPEGFKNETIDPDYAVFTTEHSLDKIMYKKLGDCETHDLGDLIDVPATCYTDGYTYKQCSVCSGQTEHTTTEAKYDHTYQEGEKAGQSAIEEYDRKDQTCTSYGEIYKECKIPGCGYKDKEVLDMLPHVIDESAESYVNLPATCTTDGVIKGECKNCKTPMAVFNWEYAFGHNIEIDEERTVLANCENDGYSIGKCINPGCGAVDEKVDEVPALGHTMKTKIETAKSGEKEIVTYCMRCKVDTYEKRQTLSTSGEYPTLAKMQEILTTDFYGGVDGAGFNNGTFSVTGSNLSMRFTNDESSSFSEKKIEGTNTYLKVHQTGTGYLNYLDGNRRPNKDIVVEISLRLPAAGAFPTGTMTAAQRITSHNVVFEVFKLEADGDILFIPGNCVIGTLTSENFSKLSFVVKPGTGCVDAYFEGELKAQNCLMKAGELNFVPAGGEVYEFRLKFEDVTDGEKTIDVDDMYMYQASLPVYVTEPFVVNAAGTNYDVSKNVETNGGWYLPNRNGVIGTGITLSSNQNFRAYIENITGASNETVSALHCKKGSEVGNIIGAGSKNESEIFSGSSVMKSKSAVIYGEIKFNAGSFTSGAMNAGRIVLAQGRKNVSDVMQTQDFLAVENGMLVTGSGKKLYSIKEGAWITYNVVINEEKGTYDVYVNGNSLAAGVPVDTQYMSKTYKSCGYKLMVISDGEFDFYMANNALYAGAISPVADVEFNDIKTVSVKTQIRETLTAVSFYENMKVSSFCDVVRLVPGEGEFLVNQGTVNAEGVSVINDGGKFVLKTTQYKTNNLKSIEFKNLLNTRLKYTPNSDPANYQGIVYDLSKYANVLVTFKATATNGYNLLIKLNTAGEGYYQIRYRVTGTGDWQTVSLALRPNEDHPNLPYFKSYKDTAGDFSDVTSLSIEFAGGIAGNGNGELMDGTTILFESIGFERVGEPDENILGENIDLGKFCKDDAHTWGTPTTVEPTCVKKGYTVNVCTKCKYMKVMEETAPKAVTKNEVTDFTAQTCTTDGIKIQRITCDCGDEYYVISEVIPAKGHDATTETACTGGCGKKLPVTE